MLYDNDKYIQKNRFMCHDLMENYNFVRIEGEEKFILNIKSSSEYQFKQLIKLLNLYIISFVFSFERLRDM